MHSTTRDEVLIYANRDSIMVVCQTFAALVYVKDMECSTLY